MKYGKYVVLIGMLFFSGCNVFEFFSPSMTGVSVQELNYRGEQYFQRQNFDRAAESFHHAMRIDPRSSEARLGYSKSLLWKILVPVANIIAEEAGKHNGDVYLGLLHSLNKPGFQNALLRGDVPLYEKIINALEGPNGIVGNQGDGVIRDDNLEVNVVLMVGYVSLIALNLLDSDGNRVFLTPPDYFILSNNRIAHSININRIVSNVTVSTTVNTNFSRDDLTNTLRGSHDAIEEVLALLRFMYLNIKYVDGLLGCVIRPSTFMRRMASTSPAYPNMYDEIRDALTNSSARTGFTNTFQLLYVLRFAPTNVGNVANELHRVLVGSYAYTVSLRNFQRSPWETHTGGLKAFAEMLPSGPITAENASNVITQITNQYTPTEISNIILGLGL